MDVSTTKTCPVQAGSEFSIVWHHYDNTTSDNVISPSHRGPCLVYLGQQQDNPDDIKWFKIYEQGFNKDTDLWCTDVVRNAHGRLSFTLPMDIVDGEYLLRTEIIALHKAKNSGGAQFFPNCVQLSITGSNKKFRCPRPKYVSIPGVYSSTDPGILYNVYNDKGANYIIPGPPVYPPTSAKPSKQLFVE
ncbi:hypothetical protein GGI00_003153 [Coemansia sp. RSA 2681]|nr:hypothetical protein GGI00_003153 [Coemansia sp. RSA 2681]